MIVTIVIVARSVVTYISIWLQGHFNFHSQMVKMAISKLKGEGASFFYFFRIIVSFGLRVYGCQNEAAVRMKFLSKIKLLS